MRDAALLALLTVGLTRDEVSELDVTSYNPETRELVVRVGKRGSRVVVLPDDAGQQLALWLIELERCEVADGALFTTRDYAGGRRRMQPLAVYRVVVRSADAGNDQASALIHRTAATSEHRRLLADTTPKPPWYERDLVLLRRVCREYGQGTESVERIALMLEALWT